VKRVLRKKSSGFEPHSSQDLRMKRKVSPTYVTPVRRGANELKGRSPGATTQKDLSQKKKHQETRETKN